MRALLIGCLLFPATLLAATQYDKATVFELETISNPTERSVFVGELKDFPHTYQFVVGDPFLFEAQVSVRPEGNTETSLIIIKEERRGVSEVDRRTGTTEVWSGYRDWPSGMKFQGSSILQAELEPGVYRLEVSSPDNSGRYRLDVGGVGSTLSWWEAWQESVAMHRYFGVGSLGVVTTWPVLLLVVFLVLIRYGLRLRNRETVV